MNYFYLTFLEVSLFSFTVYTTCVVCTYVCTLMGMSFVRLYASCSWNSHEINDQYLLLLDSLGNPFRAISRILSPQKSLAVKISFTVVEYITYTNSPQEKNLLLDIFEYINASRWDLVLYTSFGRETRIYINQWF